MGKLSAVLVGVLAVAVPGKQDKPEGYRQIVPRGRIAAVNAPTYVAASEAEIKPRSWVLGVVIDGQARAYNLNLGHLSSWFGFVDLDTDLDRAEWDFYRLASRNGILGIHVGSVGDMTKQNVV